jgi:Uma2 family endonuclease
MTATIALPPPQATPQAEPLSQYDCVLLEGISWDTYEKLRDDLDLDSAGSHVKIVYDNGWMAIMAPLRVHDRNKRLIGRMIEMTSFVLNIPIASFGSATWRRKDRRKGAEPDEGYYVQHAALIGGRAEDVDLKRDPPPDLVIEVEGTVSPVPKFPVYAGLGVPEIWHSDKKSIRCMLLGEDGQYHAAEKSLAFPFLKPAELQRFIDMLPAQDEHAMIQAFAEWVRTVAKEK